MDNSLWCAETSKGSFGMEKQGEYDYEEFETACLRIISTVFLVCDAELAKLNDNEEVLPHVAMAVRESLMAFLALTNHK